MRVLIDVDELQTLLAEGRSPRLLDVRWALDAPDGAPAHLAGHIPGAVYVSLDDDLAAHGEPTDGRHPLPTREAFQAAARSWGVNDGDSVVVYDAGPALAAARAWWLLRHAGLTDVRILDGGLAAWATSGAPVESGPVIPQPGTVTLSWGHMPVIDADAAATFPSRGTLLDARAGERYRGEVEPVDPQAGHIPGALSMPTAANVGTDGRFLPLPELAARFAGLGEAPVAVYCGSGVTAAHAIAALEVAGREAALYPGSWSQWSNQGRPVATGAQAV